MPRIHWVARQARASEIKDLHCNVRTYIRPSRPISRKKIVFIPFSFRATNRRGFLSDPVDSAAVMKKMHFLKNLVGKRVVHSHVIYS